MISTKANAVRGPTPGCVCKRRAAEHFPTSSSIACVSLAIVGFSRSSNSSRSRRRCLAHGANRIASSCSRPASRHNLFFERSPSFRATACSWFMIRVRACTIRCRCHSSCRRSRFSQLGTQICGKSSFIINRSISCASWRSVFCLRNPLRTDLGCVPDPQLTLQFCEQPFKPARMPARLHPHSHLPSLCRQITVELLRFLAVLQSPLLQFPGLGIYKSDLLKARVIIASYNDHCLAPLSRALLVGW